MVARLRSWPCIAPAPALALALGLALALVPALALALATAAGAARRDWTGSAACGACHPAQLAAWQETPHATTKRRLPASPEARCLACHGTGEAPAGAAIAVEVGCEACHGAGAAYAEDDVMRSPRVARALGLVELSTPAARAAACAGCHARGTRSTPFDPAAPVHPVKQSSVKQSSVKQPSVKQPSVKQP
ncbi:MAG TPA: multiheme c-type cytochrome [Kofleriaceae bacterium]|nr:multiheme c-type cytochrome [Kofleriaceae bacterium]